MSTSKSTGKAPARTVTVEDDDENLDDLDDVLEEFSKPPPAPKPTAAAPLKTPLGPPPPPGFKKDEIDMDFAAELAAGMESLMKELSSGLDSSVPGAEGMDEQTRRAFEQMMIGDLDARPNLFGSDLKEYQGPSKPTTKPAGPSGSGAGAPTSNAAGASSQKEDAFQKSIKEAMDRLKSSDASSKADAANAADPLAQLFASMGNMGDLGDLGGGEDMQGLLEGMMSQLMSKDLLYEPLKELNDKFPDYFIKHGDKLPKEDLDKYKKQAELCSQTVKLFEDPSYSDEDPEKSTQVLRLMNEMQALGSPPQEIMGELPPGWSLGPDGMPNMEGGEGCIIS